MVANVANVDLAPKLNSRQFDLVAGADKSTTGADKSRQVDMAAKADKSRTSGCIRMGRLSCQSTHLEVLTWPPEPIRLDGSTLLLELYV